MTTPSNDDPLLLEGGPLVEYNEDTGTDLYRANGELRVYEWLFRAGLLLGAFLFFHDFLGYPWEHNLYGLAAMLVSLLTTLTLVFRWRVMGDWRRKSQRSLFVAFTFVASIPIAATLNPTLGTSAMPDIVEAPLVEFLHLLNQIPGVGFLMDLLRGIISLTYLMITLVVLLLGGSSRKRTGLLFAAGTLTAICLFFYPLVETLAGFAFLGAFLWVQWETPVLIPDKLRKHLKPIQTQFLRELTKEGALSTGETRLYLNNNPALFAQLSDFGLVQYDQIARQVLPGSRMINAAASEAVEKGLSIFSRMIWIGIGLLYIVLPDLIPGPIDDIIIVTICAFGGVDVFKGFRRSRRNRE